MCTPPQPSVRARSLPVPSGRTATGGGGDMPSASIVDRIQPTVPSPPQHSTRRFGTFRYSSSLRAHTQRRTKIRTVQYFAPELCLRVHELLQNLCLQLVASDSARQTDSEDIIH